MDNPKIVLFDLEIIPNLKEALKVWPQLCSKWDYKTMKATVTSICCAGYKILGEKTTHCINAWDYTSWDKDINDDYTVCAELYEILKDADAVITHNGKRFDWKYLQTRLLLNGFKPLHNIAHIDTCSLSKGNLLAFNNKLDHLGESLVGERKLSHTGWQLWVDVCNGDEKAWKLMEKYCKQDVELLEKVFKVLRPFAKNIPNYNLFKSEYQRLKGVVRCPYCGSTEVISNGWRRTKTQVYRRVTCKSCGGSSRLDGKDANPRSI